MALRAEEENYGLCFKNADRQWDVVVYEEKMKPKRETRFVQVSH